jgi:hypothetical protein
MMIKEDARKRLLDIVKLAGGPKKCTNKTVLDGEVLEKVKGLAYLSFMDSLTLKESTTFGELLKIMKENITRMEPYKAIIIQKKES